MRKMTNSKELEILERRKTVSELYLRGWTQWQIGQHVGFDQGTICEDLKVIRKLWLAESVTKFDEAKAEEMAKIDLLESTAWNAWLKSCDPLESRTVRTEKAPRIPKIVGNPKSQTTRVRIEREGLDAQHTPLHVIKKNIERTLKGQTGNPAYLETIKWCVEMRLRIRGAFDKEKQGGVTVFNVNWDAMVEKQYGAEAADPIEDKINSVKMLPPADLPLIEAQTDAEAVYEEAPISSPKRARK